MLRRALALVLVPTCVLTSTAVAQSTSRGVGFRVVPGVGFASASFGDNSPRSSSGFAFTLGGVVLFPVSSTTDIVLDATWRPTKLDNPHFDESFSSIYLMGGVQFGGGSVYFRPSIGVDFQTWSGTMTETSSGTAGALGLAIGTEKRIGAGPWLLAPEGSVRFSLTGGLSSFLLLFSLGVGVRGGS
ncbi:hypothetical protein ACFL5T_00145 [Gemmatimonadota bacterium]